MKILKKIDDIADFLHKSFADLNRIHKNEISLKTELTIDLNNIKPININTKNLITIIDKINPKAICFNLNTSDKSNVSRARENVLDHSYNKTSLKNPSQNESNLESEVVGRNKDFSRQNSNFSYSTDERKNIESSKVPKPRRVAQEPNRIKSAILKKNQDIGSEVEKSITEESLNLVKLPFIKMNVKAEKIKKIEDLAEMFCVYAVGDTNFSLKYFLDGNYWQMIEFNDNVSNYKGNLRYSSLCYVSNQRIILTGITLNLIQVDVLQKIMKRQIHAMKYLQIIQIKI